MDQNTKSVIVTAYNITLCDSTCRTPGPFSPGQSEVGNHSHTMSIWTNSFESLFISLGEFSVFALEIHSTFILVTSPDCKTWTWLCQQLKLDLENLPVIIQEFQRKIAANTNISFLFLEFTRWISSCICQWCLMPSSFSYVDKPDLNSTTLTGK